MISRQELAGYLQQFLACDQYNDYAPNGLQIEGRYNITRICTAVTASADAIAKAIEYKADALLVHHGYFWRGEPAALVGMKRQRIAALLSHDINLLAYHLPLDCHLQLGNNARLCQLLELSNVDQHRAGSTPGLLWTGSLPQAVSAAKFSDFINQKLNTQVISVTVDKPIERIALCSGAAQDYLTQAQALGVDAYLSGEISERTYYEAKELGIHYFACGHHATERFGIQALGEHLAKKFKLSHQFIDSDNPI